MCTELNTLIAYILKNAYKCMNLCMMQACNLFPNAFIGAFQHAGLLVNKEWCSTLISFGTYDDKCTNMRTYGH